MESSNDMKWDELKTRCRHHYVCWKGLSMCQATFGSCAESSCPALDDEGSLQDVSVLWEGEQ